RAYLAACAAVIGGSLAYVLCDFGQWPMLMLLPYEGEWAFGAEAPDPAAMPYPGMLVWGALGAALAGALAWAVAGRRREPVSDTALSLAGGWALTAAGFAGAYYFWGLWPF